MNPGSTRRELLAGLGALAVAPAASAAAAPSLQAVLDRVAAAGTPGAMLARIRRAPTAGLDEAELEHLRMVARGLEREIALRRHWPFGKPDGSSPYVVSQRHGAYLEIGQGGASPAGLARRLDEETGRLRSDAARGVTPPDFILDSVLEAELALRTRAAPNVGAALDRQIAQLRLLSAGAGPAPGMWSLPGGENYYRLRLRCTSGLKVGAEQIERLVSEATIALLDRADRLLRGFGLTQGSVGERLRALKGRPGHGFTNDEAGRTRALAGMNAALERIRPGIEEYFDPHMKTGGLVRRMSAADERAGKRGYRDPPTRDAPGAYYPDLSAAQERPGWTLATVAFHETVPGHLLQLKGQVHWEAHPLQVKYAAGYSEGWAIYAETLVDDTGLLSPAEQLGFIQSMLFRLARVACDIGMHLRRWDRPRASRYLEDTVGFELFFPFAVEVDRYAAEPAAFAGDVAVALTLRRLGRIAAASSAGNLRVLHNVALNRGPASAEAIEEKFRSATNYP